MRSRFLCDVDGVVAEMQEAFLSWVNPRFGLRVKLEDIIYHNHMARSPALRDVDEWLRREHYPGDGDEGGWGAAFVDFMRQPDVYPRHVGVVPGSQDALKEIVKYCDVAFVTSLMKRANVHIPGKLDWIGRNFPGIPIFTVPSEYKCWVPGRFAVDDRYDTCARWMATGTSAYLFRRPWNEAPQGAITWDWRSIVSSVEMLVDAGWLDPRDI